MKEIPGYEGLYMISEKGDVYSIKRKIFMKPFHKIGDSGEKSYLRISLNKDNKKKKYFIHRLVAYAYLDEPKTEKHIINHKDGNKVNNNLENLEWVTPSENSYHAVKIGLSKGYNGTKQKRNTSGYVGVTKSCNKWKAQIRVKNKLVYLGLHDTPEIANDVYQKYYNENIKDR